MIPSSQWRGRTAGGIPYKLLEGYPQGSFDDDKATAQEAYIIEAHNLLAFVEESLSKTILIPGLPWTVIPGRSIPGCPGVVSKKVSFEPFNPDLPADPFSGDLSPPDGAYSEYLKVTIDYESGDSEDDQNKDGEEEFLNISCSSTGEFMMVPAWNSEWKSGTGGTGTPESYGKYVKTPGTPIPKIVPGLEWSIKYPRVYRQYLPTVLVNARALLGKVNEGPVPGLVVSQAESLLFLGFSLQTKFSWREKKSLGEIELKFLEKWIDGQYGHNHFWDPKGNGGKGGWDRLCLKKGDTTSTVYQLADFANLFRVAKKAQ